MLGDAGDTRSRAKPSARRRPAHGRTPHVQDTKPQQRGEAGAAGAAGAGPPTPAHVPTPSGRASGPPEARPGSGAITRSPVCSSARRPSGAMVLDLPLFGQWSLGVLKCRTVLKYIAFPVNFETRSCFHRLGRFVLTGHRTTCRCPVRPPGHGPRELGLGRAGRCQPPQRARAGGGRVSPRLPL